MVGFGWRGLAGKPGSFVIVRGDREIGMVTLTEPLPVPSLFAQAVVDALALHELLHTERPSLKEKHVGGTT